MQFGLIISALGIAPMLAEACEPPLYDPEWVDPPVSVAADGSFTDAEDNAYDRLSGEAPQDHGRGLVSQKLTSFAACTVFETLIIADCHDARAVGLRGRFDGTEPDIGGGPYLIRSMIAPGGDIDLDETETLAALEAKAGAAGYSVDQAIAGRYEYLGPQNQFDVFLGCTLHYPESPGAQS